MARYYRRRYTRVVKPKKKWATNFVSLNPVKTTENSTVMFQYVICQNANPTNVPTPVILKTGNYKVQCDAFFNLSEGTAVEFSSYIMYVPEGISFTTYNDVVVFIEKHPEWIMCWKYASFDYVSGNANIDTVRMSSRLKRNLNSGDKIMFLGLAKAGSLSSNFTASGISGRVQYWTCAN